MPLNLLLTTLFVHAVHITSVIPYADAADCLDLDSPAMMISFEFEKGALNANGIMGYSKGLIPAGIFAQLSFMLLLIA